MRPRNENEIWKRASALGSLQMADYCFPVRRLFLPFCLINMLAHEFLKKKKEKKNEIWKCLNPNGHRV